MNTSKDIAIYKNGLLLNLISPKIMLEEINNNINPKIKKRYEKK